MFIYHNGLYTMFTARLENVDMIALYFRYKDDKDK